MLKDQVLGYILGMLLYITTVPLPRKQTFLLYGIRAVIMEHS